MGYSINIELVHLLMMFICYYMSTIFCFRVPVTREDLQICNNRSKYMFLTMIRNNRRSNTREVHLVLVYSPDMAAHVQNLREVFQLMYQTVLHQT
jgi:hypothetical protein